MIEPDPEIVRLQAVVTHLNSRVRELEEALARCVAKDAKNRQNLRDVLRHYNDDPTPQKNPS